MNGHITSRDNDFQQQKSPVADESFGSRNSSPDPQQKKFKRNYKACLNCRTRKVKCDLGSVDFPNDPPCARCRRERRECIFVESRRGGSANFSAGKKRKIEEESELPSKNNILNDGTVTQLWPSQKAPTRGILESSYSGLNANSNNNNNNNNSHNSKPILPTNYNQVAANANVSSNLVLAPQVPGSNSRDNIVEPLEPTKNSNNNRQVSDITQFNSDQNALEFLAKAAGNFAKADERDRIDAREKHNALDKVSNTSKLISRENSDADLNTYTAATSQPLTTANSTSSNYTSPDFQQDSSIQNAKFSSARPIITAKNSSQQFSMPMVDHLESVIPKPSSRLSDIEYIGEDSILSERGARKLINLFFTTMHPFFPHIPPNLMDPDILAGYPILLCAILTISSRYHSFTETEEANENVKNMQENAELNDASKSNTVHSHIEVHERLWIYCQRLISQTVWAEASTRSIGTVFSFLLFTEWNPRAIHWRWSDYANKPEYNDGDEANIQSGPDSSGDGDGLAGLGAMRRSARMGWMLIGSAVRLAQDMGFMENSSRVFLACHISETHCAMNVSRRSMLSNSLSEIDLDTDDEDEGEETNVLNNVNEKTKKSKHKEADEDDLVLNDDEEGLRHKTDTKLKFSKMQKAKIELLQIMSICFENLYVVRPKLEALNKRQNLAILNILSPLLENWHKRFKSLLVTSNIHNFHSINSHNQQILNFNSKYSKELNNQVDRESLIFDYYYARLYIYSLALTDFNQNKAVNSNSSGSEKYNKKQNELRLDEISKSAKYVELAFNSAKEMLACTQRIHRLKMLKYMPVRWVTRVVRAVAFVVKYYLTITSLQSSNNSTNSGTTVNSKIVALSLIPLEEVLSIIQKAAITLREASPDELHLCTRYSTILMYLCSEMKIKIASKRHSNLEKGWENNQEPGNEQSCSIDNLNNEKEDTQKHLHKNSSVSQFQKQQTNNVANNENLQHGKLNVTDTHPLDQDFYPFPPDTVFDWFNNDNGGIGLDFVEPWTEMIEQHINKVD
ncbi:hypothetical protein PACTADRAFT_37052 [Pachysolen tannophilus NRRL Y-2460]|uniref:Zn(2)-C6 fungal-type domain-containing protein n=1 Tax=Pachysolen tannophilus NRRL Y-2460 TaxID=669874 RepID=A0A1E4U0H2_PACTA|nr:hypothetical protein PACTADRAFT_37052 [Pachysolen tannophilus NRRL Y-2460]